MSGGWLYQVSGKCSKGVKKLSERCLKGVNTSLVDDTWPGVGAFQLLFIDSEFHSKASAGKRHPPSLPADSLPPSPLPRPLLIALPGLRAEAMLKKTDG